MGERESLQPTYSSFFSPVLCNPFLVIHSAASCSFSCIMICFSLPLFSFLSLFLLYPPSFASVPPLTALLREHRGGGSNEEGGKQGEKRGRDGGREEGKKRGGES